MEINISVGDVVQLKSGGPVMTVYDIYNEGQFAKCYYFTREEILKEVIFPVNTLVKSY